MKIASLLSFSWDAGRTHFQFGGYGKMGYGVDAIERDEDG